MNNNLSNKKTFFKKEEKTEDNGSWFNWKVKSAIALTLIIALVVIVSYSFIQISKWFDTHYFQWNPVVVLDLNQPFYIQERVPEVQVEKVLLDYPDEIDTPLKEYICEKFGNYDCKIALSVASAESGLREDAYGVNTNGTIDIGVFQINQVHWEKEGCSPKELFDAYKNVDCAYQIWQVQGWTPWVAYQNGAFKNNL